MNPVLFAILPAIGMLSSIAFATWPVWFMDRLEHRHPKRALWKWLFVGLFFAGIAGWFSVFQMAGRALLNVEGTLLANILTAGVCWLIYLSAGRAETIAEQEKQRRQAERNARH